MRCAHCQQTVRPGMELVKRVEFRRSPCWQQCDTDCEVGPVHCEWVHKPAHKPGWHSGDSCPGPATAYGENMPGGSLTKGAATELPIEKILHQKCYWVVWKRENRGGDANLGTRPGLIDPYEDEDYD